MKKILVLILALTMLAPLAPAAKADVAVEPFYMLNCSPVDNTAFPHIDQYLNSRFSHLGDRVIISYAGVSLTHSNYTDEDVTKFAQAMKQEMDSRPAGMRWWHAWGPKDALGIAPEAQVYLDHGVDQMKDLITAILKKYKEIGGQLDGMVVDTEYPGLGAWGVQSAATKDPMLYKKIVTDPRYATEIRPMLVEYGFKFYENPTDYTPEIYGISRATGDAYAVSRSVWDNVMHTRLAQYLNEWCLEPLLTYYPDATVSDYQFTDTYAWLKGVNDQGEVVGALGGNSIKAGNVSNYNFYSSRPNVNFYADSKGTRLFKNPPTYNEAVYEATAFNMFLWDANLAKRMYTSTEGGKVSFWLARYDYAPNKEGTLSNTPYYAEQIFHLGLMDPEPFLGYLYNQEFKENGQVSEAVYNSRMAVIEELLVELTRVAGFSDRKPIEVPMTWNREFVLSGMYTGGRNLWRITPNTDKVSVADFKVTGSDPTFYVAGQKITFPGGKILETGDISVVGTCGYWVETAKDVTPLIQNDADRLEKIPTYIENFESYTPGIKFTTTAAKEQGAWSIIPMGNDPLVEADGNNKVLSITGNTSFQNVTLPANVTIADNYAKQQIWEITANIPAGMTADQALILLNYTADTDGDTDDLGFRLSDGKVYYADGEQHKQLFDIAAGGKYTFRRVLDLKNFRCDYILLKDGKEVASAKGIAIPAFQGKVTAIGVACENVAGKVQVDNFTLRATGAAADFEIYDAKTGKKLAANTTHSANTAYRLSWSNISEAAKTATVMADITSGGKTTTKTLKTVKLEKGYDGVETGIVEVKAGETVKIYLKTDVTEPVATQPTTEGSGETKAPTQATKATTATQAATKMTVGAATKITRPTKATKPAATKAPTQATTPVETVAPTQITEETLAPTQITEVTEEATVITEATEATQATAATAATTPTVPDREPDKGGANVGLIIAIVVVVLAAAGAAVYFLVIKKKK